MSFASLALSATPSWSACTSPSAKGSPASPFHADEEVVRTELGGRLTWQRCSVGQRFDDGHCHGTPTKLDWASAAKAAASEGHGWRLPTRDELNTLLVAACNSPATDTTVFPGTDSGWYWSATKAGDQGAWFVDFENGGGGGETLRTSTAGVRLVRNGWGDGVDSKSR